MSANDTLHYRIVEPIFARRRVGVTETGRGRLMAHAVQVPAWESVNLAAGDEVHLSKAGSFVDGRDGTFEVAFRHAPPRPDPRYAERPREHMSALVATGRVTRIDAPSRSLSPVEVRAAADANVLPPGTPVERSVEPSTALALAEGLARDVADLLAEAGLPSRVASREGTADAPARASVVVDGTPVTIVANDYGYAMVRVPAAAALPGDAGRVEGRERVARFPVGREAIRLLEAIVAEAVSRADPRPRGP